MGTGFYSNKKGIKEAKEAAGAIQYAGAKAMESVAASKAQGQAAEQAKFEVFGLLGKEGTYGKDAPKWSEGDNRDPFDRSGVGLSSPDKNLWQSVSYSTGAMGREPIYDSKGNMVSGLYSPDQLEKMGLPREGKGTGLLTATREGILDPKKYAEIVSKSVAFQAQSKRTAEANDMLNEEGEGWKQLENSSIGVINEGAAIMLRDTLRNLKNDMAKGGVARTQAMNNFNVILAKERAMRDRMDGTWKANVALHDIVRKNADAVLESNTFFINNLPLVNSAFRDSIQNAAMLQIEASEVAAAANQNAYAVKQSQQAVNFGVKLGEALIGAVASMIPYVGVVLGPAIQKAGSGGGYQAVGSRASESGSSEGGGGLGGGMSMAGLSGIMSSFGGGASSGSAAGIAGMFSDIRLKENVEKIDEENGYNIYKFNFKGDPTHTYRGVLAHEVMKQNIEAVGIQDGYLTVDYDLIGIEMRAI